MALITTKPYFCLVMKTVHFKKYACQTSWCCLLAFICCTGLNCYDHFILSIICFCYDCVNNQYRSSFLLPLVCFRCWQSCSYSYISHNGRLAADKGRQREEKAEFAAMAHGNLFCILRLRGTFSRKRAVFVFSSQQRCGGDRQMGRRTGDHTLGEKEGKQRWIKRKALKFLSAAGSVGSSQHLGLRDEDGQLAVMNRHVGTQQEADR